MKPECEGCYHAIHIADEVGCSTECNAPNNCPYEEEECRHEEGFMANGYCRVCGESHDGHGEGAIIHPSKKGMDRFYRK